MNFTKIYSQKSLPWGKQFLGNSKLEIEDYGCLMTNLTNIANYFGYSINPETLNKKLTAIGGFSGADYVWGSLSKLFTNISETYKRTATKLTDSQIKEIKKAIDNENPVMIWIDYNPKTVKNEMHWVIISDYDEKDENNFTIIDAIDGKERSLKDYLGWVIPSARRSIEAYVIYEMDKSKDTAELQEENTELKNKIQQIINIINS